LTPEDLRRLEWARGPRLPPERAAGLWQPVLEAADGAAGRGPVTLVVNDVARPPLAPALLAVEQRLAGRVRLLVAVGTHRSVTAGELDTLVGPVLADSEWRCAGAAGYEDLGETSRGTPLEVDPWVLDSSLVVLCGSVEPHYFAGFTGGRKSLLPGCCSRRTAEANHFLALDPAAGPGRLAENPVHLDMEEALEAVMGRVEVLAVCPVLRDGRLEALAAGDPGESFRSAVARCRAALPRVEAGSVPCAVLRPGAALESSLYQSMKAVYNWEPAMVTGAPVLLQSGCPEGLGAEHMERLFAMAAGEVVDISSRSGYSLGLHAAARLARAMRRLRLYYLGGLKDDLVRRLGMVPANGPEEWLELHSNLSPRLVPDAGTTAPMGVAE